MKPAKLFHAVVITGAALTGCAGNTKRPTTANNETAKNQSAVAPRPTENSKEEVCPPGSELPYPPCFLIL